MGYIELKPGRGAFVKSRSGNDRVNVRDWFLENALKLKDFIEVREAIESLAIKKAIEKGSDEEFARLEDVHKQFVHAVKTNDVVEMAFLDETFHNFIVGMTHNSLLININGLVSNEFKKYRKISFSVQANAESAVKEHQKIMAALRARAQQIAAESIAHHLNMVVVDMESVIS
jgi:GntR family transcriptional repressor for pyruvate dehydrogenase complex